MASAQAYTRPDDNVAPNATWSVTVGTAATGYPVSQIATLNPAKGFKANQTTATVRATFGASQVLVGVAIVNHNLDGASVTITSGSGLSQTIAIEPNSGGQNSPTIKDFSSALLAQRTSTTFDIAVVSNVLGNVAIGEVLLLTAIRDLRWIWGLKFRPKRLVTRHTTFGGTHLQYDKRIRVLVMSGKIQLKTEETAMRTLEDEARGEVQPWLVWPERLTSNRVHFVKFVPGTFDWSPQSIGSTEITIEAEEMSQGPPLFP